MGTLGQKLAQNIKREAQAASDSVAAYEQQRTDKAREAFQAAKAFFDEARLFFKESIMRGEQAKKVFLQVGGARFSATGLNCHEPFNAVFEGYRCADNKRGPDSLFDPKRWASLWSEFQKWANDEGLTASWHYCYDGGGMDSWWQLRVTPKR